MMRVLFMVHRFPVLTETFVLNQITGLIDRGVDVHVFAAHWGDRADLEPDVESYRLLERVTCTNVPSSRVTRIAKRAGVLASLALRRPRMAARSLNVVRCGFSAASLALCHAVSALASNGAYDVIHCHFGPMGQLGLDCRYAGAIKGRLVTTFYGYDVSSYVKRHGETCYRRLFSEGDLCIALCEPMKQRLIDLGCDPSSVVVHRIGIDTSRIPSEQPQPSASRDVRLLTIARLTEKKCSGSP
jgi:colanic acid/amylovoran biosynthesis glycosyltransferase